MDPITAIGLASAIASFIQLGAKITKRLKELSEAGDVPEVFRDIRTRLPLIISVIVSTQHNTDDLRPDAQTAFEEVVKTCFEQVSELDDILKKVTITEADSRLKRAVKAGASIVEEGRVQRIATALRDNVQLLTFLTVAPAEKGEPKATRRLSEPLPSYSSATGLFLLPFARDENFVGRQGLLDSVTKSFETHERVSLAGIGGIGKSQIAIEYCYCYKQSNPGAHILWVYAGNVARFYQGYKRIAQLLGLPGWDDPNTSILELVREWFLSTQSPFLLVIDNADSVEHWWPSKYKSVGSSDNRQKNLAMYLPHNSHNGRVLITTRDNRVAKRLAKQGTTIAIESMSREEAKSLFLSKSGEASSKFDDTEVHGLVEHLDHLPLAVAQAAAFIEENNISIKAYTDALQGEDAEEFLHEELDDGRRDEESINSVFRTWKLSYDQIKEQKPHAVELLSLIAMLDRQSIPRSLLKVPEVTTSLAVLQSFNLVTARAGSQSFQIHRLVQLFVCLSLKRDNISRKWQETALACVSQEYPVEIGVAEWPLCDALAPHVEIVTRYDFETREAQLDLAHLLCWAADFDIERGMYSQALDRAARSLGIFQELVAEDDERLAAATWLYGRLRYYEARCASDLSTAAGLLQKALDISKYPSLSFAETAFELAHLYYDQCNEEACLKMGKASFECWTAMAGPNSSRTLDNMHDYALELAVFGHETEAISMWQEILERCPNSNASENTKIVYTYRSMAGIAEFQGDVAMAEIFYAKLITVCEAIYNRWHVHVFDYRLSHAEQIMNQGRLEEATRLSKDILSSCSHQIDWNITASCLQTIAECCRLGTSYSEEEAYRREVLDLHERKLGGEHKETVNAREALADCYLTNSQLPRAQTLYQEVISCRDENHDQTRANSAKTLECLGVCHALQHQDVEAEAAYLEALDRQSDAGARLLDNLCACLLRQGKWVALEARSRQLCEMESEYHASAQRRLIKSLEQQRRMEDEALEMRTGALALETPTTDATEGWQPPTRPPARRGRRFGRMIHPRTWSA